LRHERRKAHYAPRSEERPAVADIEKISIALTREQMADVKAAIDAGEYATPAEVVADAVRVWQAERDVRRNAARLRRLWDEGKASGDGGSVDFGELRSEARRRLEAARGRRE
jgi:antitoxin ParD1/3/4